MVVPGREGDNGGGLHEDAHAFDHQRAGAASFLGGMSEPIYDMLINRVAIEVEERANQRRSRRWGIWFVAAGLAAGAIAYLHLLVVEKSANNAVENRLGRIESKIETADLSLQMTEVINKIEAGDGFTSDQQEAALSLLAQAAVNEDIKKRASFLPQLESLANSFASADVGVAIDKVDDLYRAELQRGPNIVGILAQHYGMRLLRTPNAPSDWETDPFDNLFKRYLHYAHAAKTSAYPEIYLLFEMIVEHMLGSISEQKNDTTVKELLLEVNDLNAADNLRFFQLLANFVQYEDEPPSEKVAEFRRLARHVKSFLEAYSGDRDEFKSILNGTYPGGEDAEVLDPSFLEEFERMLEQSGSGGG